MATYIVLAKFTDQGIRKVKDSPKRAVAAKELSTKFGVTMKDIYWTLGQYDMVTIFEAENDAAMAAFGLAVGTAGNLSFQTLPAFTKEEIGGILGKLG